MRELEPPAHSAVASPLDSELWVQSWVKPIFHVRLAQGAVAQKWRVTVIAPSYWRVMLAYAPEVALNGA